jgi:D-arabinose 1-dehydrogenase-like Zn-dependent alcohol dehydrogenase
LSAIIVLIQYVIEKSSSRCGSGLKCNHQHKGADMKKGEKLVIVGCSGSGGPAAMMSKKLMPEVDVTVIRKEEFFIVR